MGRLVTSKLLAVEHAVTCFSRDEQKQRTLPQHRNLDTVIGDIRDYESIRDVMDNQYDVVINFAALKCVDSVEANPYQSVQTNILGVKNLIRASQRTSLPKIIFTSTDKACYPINVYGQCKAVAEKLVMEYAGPSIVYRYGNILGSRGSVLSAFVKTIAQHGIAKITDMNMTRFWVDANEIAISIARACDEVVDGNNLRVKVSKTMRVVDVARAVADELGVGGIEYTEIGMRPGEKIHETIVTKYDEIASELNDVDSHGHERYEHDEFREIIRPIVLKIKEDLRL